MCVKFLVLYVCFNKDVSQYLQLNQNITEDVLIVVRMQSGRRYKFFVNFDHVIEHIDDADALNVLLTINLDRNLSNLV